MDFFELQDGDAGSEGGEDVEERGARGVEADAVEDEAGVGKERGGAEEECGGRNIAGDRGFDGVEFLRAGDGDGIDGASERGAEGTQREFAVVAGADGFADDCGALGLQAGEQNAGLDLGAGNGRGEVDGVERSAFDGDGRVAVGEGEVRAHFAERLANALHGAAGERCIADEGEGALLRREQAGDHAHRGAGVAAIERMIGWSDAATDAVDFNAAVIELADFCAEGLHAGEGGGAVGAGGEVGEARGALSKCAEQGVAMADGFVAGQAQGAEDVARGADDAFLRGGVTKGLRKCGVYLQV